MRAVRADGLPLFWISHVTCLIAVSSPPPVLNLLICLIQESIGTASGVQPGFPHAGTEVRDGDDGVLVSSLMLPSALAYSL